MIKVILVSQQSLVAAGIHLLLESADDMHVVGEADGLAEAVKLIAAERPDIVLLKAALVAGAFTETMDDIAAASPDSRVLVLTDGHDGDGYERAIMAGAAGVVFKHQ